jgi:hypothetical protein
MTPFNRESGLLCDLSPQFIDSGQGFGIWDAEHGRSAWRSFAGRSRSSLIGQGCGEIETARQLRFPALVPTEAVSGGRPRG